MRSKNLPVRSVIGWAATVVAAGTVGVCPAAALAGGGGGRNGGGKAPPDYGLQWCEIGDPGNRATLPHEVPGVPPPFPTEYGAVAYKYRMTRTEITAGQWLEFVEAYGPFNKGDLNDNAFTGPYIDHIGGGFVLFGDPNRPTTMSFEFAARFANWMHNDKALAADAFESGAYDTSTFYVDDQGVYHHQAERSPGAKFWIPNLDEWTKAAHWDPEADRYWYHQGGQDEPLISGPPGVGQTNAGIPGGPDLVGQYSSVTSPWGLLDSSGGTGVHGNRADMDGIRERDSGDSRLVAPWE